MARDISVSIAVQGEKEFNQALKNAQSAVKVLASELKAGEAAFDENADAQSYFANRTRLINAQIEQERTIIKSLEQAVREAASEFGEADAKTDKYRIALNRANGEMAKLEKALRDTQKEAEELGRDSTRVGRQIENGIGDAASDAANKLDKMVTQISRDMSDIGSAVEFSALSDLGSALASGINVVVSGISNLTEGTVDYRRQMAILEQNAKDMGFDPEWLKQQAAGIAALTGNMDGAIEAVSNLARAAPDVDSFTLVMNRLLGATLAWPETFNIENLAESLQESLAGGQITGAYSELATRLGLDIETINKSLSEATKKGTEALWDAGTAWTSEHGFEQTIEEFKAMNAELLAYNESKIKLTDAEARLAELLTPAATAGIETLANMINATITAYENFMKQVMETRAAAAIAGEEAEKIVENLKSSTDMENLAVEMEEEIINAYAKGDYLLAEQLKLQKEKILEEIAQMKIDAANAMNQDAETKDDGKKSFWEILFGGGEETAAEEAGKSVDQLTTEVENAAKEEESNMKTIGGNFSTQVANGMTENIDVVSSASLSLWEAINNILTKQIVMPAPKFDSDSYEYNGSGTLKGGGSGKGEENKVMLVAQIEKRTVARAVYSDVGEMMGASAEYYDNYA